MQNGQCGEKTKRMKSYLGQALDEPPFLRIALCALVHQPYLNGKRPGFGRQFPLG
jgi:hypothetical protein